MLLKTSEQIDRGITHHIPIFKIYTENTFCFLNVSFSCQVNYLVSRIKCKALFTIKIFVV